MNKTAIQQASHTPHAWEKPLPILPDMQAPQPFPMSSLPPLMRDAAQAIASHVKAPPELAAYCVISAASHLAQCRVNAPHLLQPSGMPCSLFTLVLADSGDRKSQCDKLALKEVSDSEKATRSAWQKDIAETNASYRKQSASGGKKSPPPKRPPDPRTIYGSDASYTKIVANFINECQPYATWATDEGGQFFGSHNMKKETVAATIGGLVKWFDEGAGERDRATDNADGSGFAHNRRLGINLLAQEVAVRDALDSPLLQGQGFLPRFLFASATTLAGTRQLTKSDLSLKSYSDRRLQRYWARCRCIMDTHPLTTNEQGELTNLHVLPLTDAATTVWLEYFNRWESAQAPLQEFSALRPFAGRAGELLRRLATVLAYFEGQPNINDDTMSSAAAIVEHSLSEWARYIGAVRADPTLKAASEVLHWLTKPHRKDDWAHFDRAKWGKCAPKALRPAAKRDKVLAILTDKHCIHEMSTGQYAINPALLELAETADSAESPTYQGIADAEDLRPSAETIDMAESPATIRKISANANSGRTRLSAETAESAHTEASA
ncbi:MAG: DUF3987 domain-containing protein [Oceanococcus sp.]